MKRHAFTLLETLIALVLVLALGALVFPALIDSLHERAFETAADVTNEQLMLARAHAQATGEPVEVTYHAGTKQVEARFFTPWLSEGITARIEPGTSPLAHVPMIAVFGEAQDEQAQARPITEPWATRALADGIKMVSKPPAAELEALGSEDAGVDAPFENDLASFDPQPEEGLEEPWPTQDIRLAVFMPDGSALLGDPVWLGDADGRWGQISINPWSGLPLFQRLAEVAAASAAKADAPPEPDEDDDDEPPPPGLYPDDELGRPAGTGG